MSTPAYPPVIAAALLKAQRAVRPVEGRGKGWDDRGNLFRFALAEDVIEAARGPLLDAGLMFVPSEWAIEERGTTAWVARPVALIHESGAALCWTVRWPLVPGHGRPMDKAIAAAATTSLAYALRDLLQIPRPNAGDDVDDRSRNATPSASPPSPKSPQADRDAKPPNITIRPWKCRLTSRNGDREERTAATPEAAAVLLMQGVHPDWGPKGGKRHERVEIETPAGLMAYRMGYDRKTERWQVEADDGAPLPGSSLVEGSEVERALGVETGALFADDSTDEGAREGSSSVQPVAMVAAGPSMQAEGTGARPAAEAAEVAHDRPPALTTRAEGPTGPQPGTCPVEPGPAPAPPPAPSAPEKRDAARKILLSVAARCAECDEPMDPEAGSCPSASCPTHDAEDVEPVDQVEQVEAALVEADAKLAADGGRCPDCRDLVDPVPASGARFPCPKCDTTLVVGNDARGERFLAVAALVVGAVMEHVPTGRRLTVLGISGRCVSVRDGGKPELEAVDAVDLRADQEPSTTEPATGADDAWGSDSPQAKAREEELARQARKESPPAAAAKARRHRWTQTGTAPGEDECMECGRSRSSKSEKVGPCPGQRPAAAPVGGGA